jgi:transposase-like protein
MSKQTGAHKLSETEGLAHIESYLASGLRPSEYYRKHNLSEYQFYNWRRRYQSVRPELFASRSKPAVFRKEFHEVKFIKESVSDSASSRLEIHYPHGVKVIISTDSMLDLDMLSYLIKLVR